MDKRLFIPTLLEQLETDNYNNIEDYSRGIYSAVNAITVALTKIIATDEPHREKLLKDLVIEAAELLTMMARYPKNDLYNALNTAALIAGEHSKNEKLQEDLYKMLENEIQQERKKQSEK